jgi:Na+/H+-dicarboxylate symporter/ABC-type amino acid transport substrate-binding protein
MTFSRQILVGLALGILTGLFFGEDASALKWVADGFVKLLQMMVLPYITVSIVASLGSLQPSELRTLGVRAAAVIGGLWILALAFAFLVPLTFPSVQNASFFSTSLVEPRPAFDFIDLYIPSNPFNSLANNVVPAVVLFSVILGIAVVGVVRRERLLDVLLVARDAISAATRFVTRLTPYGLFAIAANAAGTLGLEQLGRLQVYLVAYVAISLLVSLWVLPGLVAALTPIRVKDVLSESRDSLITAFIAGDLFIVLPGLMQASRTLLARLSPGDPEPGRLTEVIVPASFNFPHTGKLLSLSFILFAGWFSDAPVPFSSYPQLALAGLVTFFGSLSAAVPFLLDLFRIPTDTFQLFLATGVVNSRVGSLVAAVHTLVVALLVSCAATGRLQRRRGALLSYVLITVTLAVVVIGGARVLFANSTSEYSKDKVLASMYLLQQPVEATVARTASPPADVVPGRSPLDDIKARNVLRVCYLPASMPFAFFNARGDLVGFDIELAHRLARELRVSLAFVPADRTKLPGLLADGYCDLAMSGVVVTTLRAGEMLFSESYLDETLALMVADYRREQFASWDAIRDLGAVTILAPDLPYYIDKLRELAPRAVLKIQPLDQGMLPITDPTVDAVWLPAERGSSWTLMFPQYSVVVPGPTPIRVPLAFPIGKHDERFASFINTWIALKRKDGTLDAAYKHWILGQDAEARQPRWSIIRNVLHWVE